MRKKIFISSLIILIYASFSTSNIYSQEKESKSLINVSADIVSSYLWRGSLVSATPNIQPSITFGNGNLTCGVWGSTDLAYNSAGAYKELDFFIGYSTNGFSATLYDYFWSPTAKYGDFNKETTGHVMELELAYENENFPIKILAATMFYGDDKKSTYDLDETDMTKNNYSTYIELGYTFTSGKNNVYGFFGITPFTGMYGTEFNGINLGLTANRNIQITDKFTLPVFVTAAANPQTENVYILFGFSL